MRRCASDDVRICWRLCGGVVRVKTTHHVEKGRPQQSPLPPPPSPAAPAVVVLVALAALLAYLASALSSADQRAMSAERDNAQIREQSTAVTRQMINLQKDIALAKSPGRTTVILDPADGKKAKDGSSWAAVVWGELPDGKSFMRVNGYGLGDKPKGTYRVWMQPQSGDPINLGDLEVDQNGSGFTMTTDLPPVDQGKSVMMTDDPPGTKQPGQVLAKADLPTLKPIPITTATPPPATPPDVPQAKTGSETQQMH